MQNAPFLTRFATESSSRDQRKMGDTDTADEQLPLALEKRDGYVLCPITYSTEVDRETTDDC